MSEVREESLKRLVELRARTLRLIAPLTREQLRKQHSPLQGPIVWDLGHIAAFEELWLTRNLDGNIEFTEMPGLYNPFEHPRRVRGQLRLPGLAEVRETMAEIRGRVLARLADADLDSAVKGAVSAGFYNSGQACTAGSRLLVDRSIHSEFLEKLVKRSRSMTPGDPLHGQRTVRHPGDLGAEPVGEGSGRHGVGRHRPIQVHRPARRPPVDPTAPPPAGRGFRGLSGGGRGWRGGGRGRRRGRRSGRCGRGRAGRPCCAGPSGAGSGAPARSSSRGSSRSRRSVPSMASSPSKRVISSRPPGSTCQWPPTRKPSKRSSSRPPGSESTRSVGPPSGAGFRCSTTKRRGGSDASGMAGGLYRRHPGRVPVEPAARRGRAGARAPDQTRDSARSWAAW